MGNVKYFRKPKNNDEEAINRARMEAILARSSRPDDEDFQWVERRICIGCIVSHEFCQWMAENFRPKYLIAAEAKLIIKWCVEYFKQYKKAPERDIEAIFALKTKEGTANGTMSKENQGVIEEVLRSLSDEYDRDRFNVPYLIDQVARYFDRQTILATIDEAEAATRSMRYDLAREIMQKLPAASGSLLSQLHSCMISSTEFAQREIPRPLRLLRPWLTEGSLTLVFGPRGVGKTWLCNLVAMALTRNDQTEIDIGPWQPKHKAGVLYVDAEMNNYEMQDNIRKLSQPLPPEDEVNPLMILSAHDFAQRYEKQFNIADKATRDAICEILRKDRRLKVLILDNTSALTPGLEENSKEAWDPVNQWLIQLRHLGVATILVHHAGKGGMQRGTSGREDAMDTIIKLDYPNGYDHAKDYAWFRVAFEKGRNLQPGDSKAPFTIRIVEHEDGGLTWRTEDEKGKTVKKSLLIIAELVRKRPPKEIMGMFGCGKQQVTNCKALGIEQGYLKADGSPTEKGIKLMEEVGWHGGEAVGL